MDLKEIQWPDVPFNLLDSAILIGKRGSEAHNTFIPTTDPNGIDDRDIMGVCIPPIGYYFGLKQWSDADSIKGPWDVVLYEFKKFVGLLVKQNPNVIGTLYLRPEDYLYLSGEGKALIKNRDIFVNKTAAFKSFAGYADSQFKRMTRYAVTDSAYMGKKRRELIEKYGYDCKNAAHLIRLLRMCKEYMETGVMQVFRTNDAEELKEIKSGKWTVDRVNKEAERGFQECREAYEHSTLPDEIDFEKVDKLTKYILIKKLLS